MTAKNKPLPNIELPYEPRPLQLEMHDGIDRHRFSVIVAHRRFGKTVAVINHLIRGIVDVPHPRPRAAYVAPQYNQAKQIAWDYLRHYTSPIPGIKRNESELYVEMPVNGGARVKLYGADNPNSLRGLYFDLVVLDEVAQMKPDVWGEVIRPALADRKGKAIFIGTPRGINLFHDLYQIAATRDDWFLGVYRADRTGVLDEEELDVARETMSEPQYRQEFLCDFGASNADVLIPLDLVLRATKRKRTWKEIEYAPKVMGLDVARFGDDKSAIVVRRGLKVTRIEKTHDMDLMQCAEWAGRIIREEQPDAVFVDEAGLGAGVVDRLRMFNFTNVIGVSGAMKPGAAKYKNKRAEIWDLTRDWLENGGEIPNDNELVAQLPSVQYLFDTADRLQLMKKADLKKEGLPSPDVADALTLTFAYPVQDRHTPRKSPHERVIDRVLRPETSPDDEFAEEHERTLRQLTSGDPWGDDDYDNDWMDGI